jgi:hypothetical protein
MFPFLVPICQKLGIGGGVFGDEEHLKFFWDSVESIMKMRHENGKTDNGVKVWIIRFVCKCSSRTRKAYIFFDKNV